ncbi:MAG: DegT/DnrJ/EryC1/StrS family aminotransferase [Bacteroidales bacterium]|nr:DegT/DnrJ/EryC1/StrS family aminotransferase [Bacteroidales bacterium]
MSIKVTRASLPSFGEFCEEIRPLWDSHILTNMGPLHQRFAAALREYLGCAGITLFSHGHSALEAALRALRLPAGSRIITTPFTFASTVHAISRLGFEPVFCDVLPSDGTLDPSRLEGLIDSRTSAVLPVHVYGNACDADAIGAMASRHGLKVVYDAAHAFGVRLDGAPLVCRGDASVLSFHATKVFNTVEGGAVCFTDGSLRQALDDEKNFGIRDEVTCAAAGGNAKMNELQAAMGLCNLRHIDDELHERERLDAVYRRMLAGAVDFFEVRSGATRNHSYMPVLLRDGAQRDAVYDALLAAGVNARKYFWPLVCDAEPYRGLPADVPVARGLSERVLALPLYPGLPEEEVVRIGECCKKTVA